MLLSTAAYLAAHFVAYVVVLRHRAGLRSEKGIFPYHFVSLAQGGYSLSIVSGGARTAASGTEPDFSALAAIGEAKQGDGVAGLEKLGLVARTVEPDGPRES